MKRYILIGLAILAVLTISVSLAAAQDPSTDAVPTDGYGANFVDEDGDGVCDNCGSGSYGRMHGNGGVNFVDEDGDGVCDNCGSGSYGQANGGGANFVDEDGDGVCDYYGSGPRGQGQGRGRMANRFASAQS
jgi:hypothetical protein